MANYRATLGLEEEFFALEQGQNCPTLQSMDYLRRFVWSNIKQNLKHSASNFAKGADRKQCFMGSIELSTGKHDSVDSLVEDLVARRTGFAKAMHHALVVPTGALFHHSSPSNTACSHIHVGVPAAERLRVYHNLCWFAPPLAVYAANSPYADGKYFGLSYRMAQEGLLGSLTEDPEYRFQDVIISKRLGTIEMRIFDPIPELNRLTLVLKAVQQIAEWGGTAPFDREQYNANRPAWLADPYTPWINHLWQEAAELGLPVGIQNSEPLSIALGQLADAEGIDKAYQYLDGLWREPTGIKSEPHPYSTIRMVTGMAGYYIPRLPLIAVKGYQEWYGKNGGKN